MNHSSPRTRWQWPSPRSYGQRDPAHINQKTTGCPCGTLVRNVSAQTHRHRDAGLRGDTRALGQCRPGFNSMELAGVFSQYRLRQSHPCPPGRAWLAPKPKDALDVSGEATLGLLLQLVLKGREGHVVEGQVKEQRLARDGLESRWEVHKVGLLGDKGRVQAECLKPFNQRLQVKPKGGSRALTADGRWNPHCVCKVRACTRHMQSPQSPMRGAIMPPCYS